ncbi:MAG: undecaprenyldiphospho-muramoylpentapeptide beta-N-acetylglucosaminyltransferase [Bacteroidia bacterium]|nr:undecaprenyldiphospho-muramoylpentapeptide beta-N-acetylglucosaminyltransferase [Bacteroidia bacterium]
MSNYRFIVSGGGTGGHIYPAIAIATALKGRFPQAEFLFVGAKDRMEMEKVPQAGFEIIGLWISGLQRSLSLKNLMFPFKVLSSLIKARKILKDFKPDMAIGTGGYASAPVLKAAAQKGIPYVIQEQNSYAGITNKWLAKKAAGIYVAYEGMERFFPESKIVLTGNPVRKILTGSGSDKKEAFEYFGLSPQMPVLLIIGGSLGSARINQLIEEKSDWLQDQGIQLLWQCGNSYYKKYQGLDQENVRVKAFVNKMDYAYAIADIIISRAGAGTISELCIVGKPAVLIPSPHVAEDHQTKNALALVARNAALLIPETELEERFEIEFERLLSSAELRTALSNNIKTLAKPNATENIVNEIENLLMAS